MNIRSELTDLVDAFNTNALGALHIDLQNLFYSNKYIDSFPPTSDVYPIVKNLSSNLRGYNIPNNWVVFTGNWNKTIYKNFKTSKPYKFRSFSNCVRNGFFNMSDEWQISSKLNVNDEDFIFEKPTPSAFKPIKCLLTDHLKSQKIKVIIIDGVHYEDCVMNTITDGIELGFRFYVVMDAVNCPFKEIDDFAKCGFKPEDANKVTLTTTKELLSVLRHITGSQMAPSLAVG